MPFEKKYSDELKDQAINRVIERRRAEPDNRSILREVAEELDIGEQSLRGWIKRLDDRTFVSRPRIKAALDPVPDSAEAEGAVKNTVGKSSLLGRIAALEAQVEALKTENEILKRAAVLFAAELNKN